MPPAGGLRIYFGYPNPGALLNELDQELERRGHCFVGYADDCSITILGEHSVATYFEADVGGVYEVQLTVSDGHTSLTDTVVIDVIGKPTVNLSAVMFSEKDIDTCR